MGIIKDPTSWRTGFELGLAGFSFPYSKPRKPTAYLYNGIRLPALTEWDRVRYPYAYIFVRSQTMYSIVISPVPAEYVSGMGWIIRGSSLYADALSDSIWSDWKIDENDLYIHLEQYSDTYRVIWCNTDLVYPNSTVYMAASEPVPVYE